MEEKLVLDLGCSGGYFSFKIARRAAHVWAVDADPMIIERNQSIAEKYGYRNITFICDLISPELIQSLPKMDVVLFLSVFHHMLTASDAYGWNRPRDMADTMSIFPALADQTETLVFEMGYPSEGYEWSRRLPPMLPSARLWISSQLHEYFDAVDIIETPAYQGIVGGIRRRIAEQPLPSNIVGSGIRRLFALDPRDVRDIFVAHRLDRI